MLVEIGGKEYTLNFGFKFLEYIDMAEGTTLNIEGAELPKKQMGLEFSYMLLNLGTSSSLKSLIRGGLITEKSQPSDNEVIKYIETLSGEEDADGNNKLDVFEEELKAEVKKQPLSGRRLRKTGIVEKLEGNQD